MNKQKIEKIITEIISIDDEMKKFEKEIRSIAHTFSKSQPNLEINDNFKNNLKHKIMNEINKIKKDKKGEEKKAFNWMIFSKKLAFSLGAIALLIAIIIPLKNNLEKNDGKLVLNNKDKQEQTEKFVRVEDSAFGKIALSTNNSEGETKTPATVSADNTLTSNEEANRESSVSVLGLGAGTGGEIVASNDSRILPYPYEPINYEFDYVGDDFELNGEKVDVYKKIVKSLNTSNLTSNILNTNFELINLDSFKNNTQLTNISLNQENDYGYNISLNPQRGTISLYANWETWPQRNNNSRLKYNNIPADEKIIEIADKFLKDKEIDLSEYGNAVVVNDFRKRYTEAKDKSMIYFSDQISVVYPLIIDGTEVVDNSGNKTGLYVSVNIREMKVYSLNNLNSNSYLVSAYKAISDKEEILNYVKQGGLYPNYQNPEAKKTVTIQIGSPVKTLVKSYKFNSDKGLSDEFFVPALSFPILNNNEENNYYRSNIVIPLAQDMIEKHNNIEPMPMIDMAR